MTSEPQSPEIVGELDFSNVSTTSDPNSKVFWSVNCFIIFLICMACVWCLFVQRYVVNEAERRIASDEIYRTRLQQRREAATTEPPEKRRRRLLQSFKRNKVEMTVEEADLISDKKCNENEEKINHPEDSFDDIETGEQDSNSLSEEETGQLKLPSGDLVPNCCAVCLSEYRVGDVVTWSSNPKCVHAFHRECVVNWLVKMQPETPCPCCRQEFTDLEALRKERKIKWAAAFAFDFSAVYFR